MRDQHILQLLAIILTTALINISSTAPATQQGQTTVSLDQVESHLEDKVVAELEGLREHSTENVISKKPEDNHQPSLPALEKQLENLQTSHHDTYAPVFPLDREIEDPVSDAKSTTTTSREHHHERPNLPPFDADETTTKKEEEKVTPKTYSGAARLTGCATCGADQPSKSEPEHEPEEEPLPRAMQKRINLDRGARMKTFPQSIETIFSQNGKQYSANDLAQYIFWTGDETGVARAIEELIDQSLISREAALLLLKQIRAEIENLQDTYAKEELMKEEPSKATLSPMMLKTLAKLPDLLKMNEIEGSTKKLDIDYDETTGRLRLADFLYAEYSLEEVIYQLAKVMFSQSLNQGSDEAQIALQRLTNFLENEGAHRRISPALQRKVLDVLLAALSDTLNENPDMMAAAKQALGSYLNKLPKHSQYKN